MAATKRDYYEVLGVTRTATADEIKKQYRAKARQLHPDVNKAPEAESQFKEVSEAYEVLIDTDKRAAYDRFGHAAVSGAGGGGGADPFGGFGPFSDIFETFFSQATAGSAGGATRRRPQRGSHLAYRLTIEFEEAVFGTEKEVDIPRLAICPKCEGSGAEPGTEPQTCPVCQGRGEQRRVQQSIFGQFVSVVPCERCHGEGKIIATPCSQCKGEGRIKETRKLAVKVPAGIDDGSQIRLAGEGEAGPRGSAPGDLYIEVNIKQHKLFRREGSTIILDLGLNMAQAALGADIQVPTVDGEETLLKVPNGTQNGKEFRIKGFGVPYLRGAGRGDMVVRANVQIPTSLTEEQKRLLRELSKTLGEATPEPQEKGFLGKIKDALGG
ncbi:MAG: molecular chaperone DnaJ [Chloroflexota bacterium]|nr:molecular chaperone DnaJ [Chloroflexota bacterium]